MKFQPHNSENAIVRVLFACEFAQILDEGKLAELEKLYDKFKDDLPQKTQQSGLRLKMTPGHPPQPETVLSGFAFTRYASDGQIVRQFTVQPNFIAYADMDYTRWEKIWPSAKEKLEAALALIGDVSLQAYGLEYQDRFFADGHNDVKIDVTSVFNKNSKYLAQNIFELPDLWHSHYGSIQEEQLPCKHTGNDNIKLALVRRTDLPPPNLAVEITLQHRRVLDEPISSNAVQTNIAEFFDNMHEHDRNVMLDLLTPEMADRIKLKKKVL